MTAPELAVLTEGRTKRFGDLTATFACGFHGKTNTLEVVGADGLLRLPHAFSDPDGVVLVNGFEHRAEPGGDYREQLADFCAAIHGERAPLIDCADTLGQARALDALLRAAAGRT